MPLLPYGSPAQSNQQITMFATGNTTQSSTKTTNASSIIFAASGAVSVGVSGGSILVSVTTQTNQQITMFATGNTTQSSTRTANVSSLIFAASGAASVGVSGGSVLVSAQSNQQITMFAGSNTSISSTGTVNASSMNFFGAGGASVEVSANNVIISALANTSTVGGTVGTLSRLIYPEDYISAISVFGNGSYSIRYMNSPNYITGTRMDALVSWSASSSGASNTAAIVITAIGGIYTRNASTLNTVSTGTTQSTYTYASNTAGFGSIHSVMLPISVPINVNMSPGEYYVGFGFSTNTSSIGANTTNLAQTISMFGDILIQTGLNYAEWLAGTATSKNIYPGIGIFTAATTAIPATINLNNINQTGANLSRALIAIVIRNY